MWMLAASYCAKAQPFDTMVTWTRDKLIIFDIQIRDLDTSWKVPLNYCALINLIQPNCFNLAEAGACATDDEKVALINTAFDIAEDKYGIPRLMDAEDLMLGTADRCSIFLYVASIRAYLEPS